MTGQTDDNTAAATTSAANDKASSKQEQHSNNAEDSDALEIVLVHVGEFGRYQKLLFVSMMPFAASFAFVYLSQMFIVATPKNYWCKVAAVMEAEPDPMTRRKYVSPLVGNEYDGCLVHDVDWKTVLAEKKHPPPGTPTTRCTSGWEFDFTDIPYSTITTERGWVCEKAHYVPITSAVFFLGASVGGLISGWMADKYGRVPALCASNLVGYVGCVGSKYTTGMWDFAVCRFIAGMAFDNCFTMIFILVLEYVGPSHRTLVANMSMAIFFGGFCVLLPWLAYWLRNWRTLVWVTSAPMLVAFAAPYVIPESARWLISRGHTERAVKVLRSFEKVNGTKIPEQVMDNFIKSADHIRHDETITTLCKCSLLRTGLLLMVGVYGTGAVVYDALVRMSENLGMNFFVTFTLNAATEIPANAMIAIFLDRLGRRLFTFGPMGIAGILALIAAFVPKGPIAVLLAVVARFTVILGFNAATQWTTEILPTAVRASGSSLVHISGYLASLLSPPIVFLDRMWTALPLILISLISLTGAVMAAFLPETRGLPLPQTIVEGTHLFKMHNPKWRLPFLKRGRESGGT